MSQQSLQFGIFDIFQVEPDRPPRESMMERIGHHMLADQPGLDSIFLAERHFMPFYRSPSLGLILATLATSTNHARQRVRRTLTLLVEDVILLV